MSGGSIGRLFRVTTFGEPHGDAVGAIVEGCPAGVRISLRMIQRELDRRRPGRGPTMSARKEPDRLEVLSGILRGRTTGGPVRLQVQNVDARSGDYDDILHKPRPGHADLAFWLKHGAIPVGGGRASGRETVGRVLAGAVAKQLLAREGMKVAGRVLEVGGRRTGFRQTILAARSRADSAGGTVELVAEGVPPGLGEPVFDRLDADLAKALMSIGGVKGVEVGAGFSAARRRGSENNDAIIVRKGRLLTRTNNAGGILGGMSNGMPVVCRIAVKPPSSIGIGQDTVDLRTMRPARIRVGGRHDPYICERIVPVAEAMVAVTLLDHLLRARASAPGKRVGMKKGDMGRPLGALRAEILLNDAELVRLLGRRMELAEKIGRRKRSLGLPVRDARVERAVLANARAAGKGAGERGKSEYALKERQPASGLPADGRPALRTELRPRPESLSAPVAVLLRGRLVLPAAIV